MLSLSSDRLEEALRQLNQVVEADPENADAHYLLDRAWTKMGQPRPSPAPLRAFREAKATVKGRSPIFAVFFVAVVPMAPN